MDTRKNSASSLKTLNQCTFKYFQRYGNHAVSLEGTENTHLPFGRAVHAGLEEIYRLHMERFGTEYTFSEDDRKHFYNVYVHEASEGGITNMALLKEGWDLLTAYLDSFDYSERAIAIEEKVDLTLDNGVRVFGYIDKVIELDDDTIAIVDYKTSRTALTQDEADIDIQLSLYDLVATILWPQYSNIIVVLDYVRLGETVMSYRSAEARSLFSDWLKEQDLKISKLDEKSARPNLNQFCGWCGYRQQCPAFRSAATCFDAESYMIGDDDTDEIISKWTSLKRIKSVVAAAERDLKMQLDERLSREETGELSGKSSRIYRSQSTRVSYDVVDIKGLLPPEDLYKVCTVNKRALDKYVADKPSLAGPVKEKAHVSYTAASVRTASNKSSRYNK